MNRRDLYESEEYLSWRVSGPEEMNSGIVFTTVGVGMAMTTCTVLIVVCCVFRRKQTPDKTVVKEGYSVAVDSVSVHNYEQHHYTEYAIPEDALATAKAQYRISIGDGEYDTLTRNFKQTITNTGHVYSHVTLGNESKRESASSAESPYDVTPYGKMTSTTVTVGKHEKVGDMYGHVTINPMETVLDEI